MSDLLRIGLDGSGALTVSDGGLVTAKTLRASLSDLHGNGTITASVGAVLDADMVFDAAHGNQQTLSFGSGGTLNLTVNGGDLGVGVTGGGSIRIADGVAISSRSGYIGSGASASGTAVVTGTGSKWINSSQLYVGSSGSGALTIEGGGQVSNTTGNLATNAGSVATATVSGAGSKWTNGGSLYVGRYGSATLTVADGGLVSAKTIYASPSDLHGNGTITASGAVLDADLVFDATHGTSQALSFGAGGTLNLTVDGTGSLGAGHKGTGSLRIADGVTVASSSGEVGFSAGSAGTATVSGSESKWTSIGTLNVGSYGSGTLIIEAGGHVASSSGYVGNNTGSSGIATVTGAGSMWTNSGSLYAGYFGSGALVIEAGGQVSGKDAHIGYGTAGSGTVAVLGTGSTWTNSAGLYVGNAGSGTLTVTNGGLVTAKTLHASPADLLGDGTITASGAVLDSHLVFDGAHGTMQALGFGAGGTLKLTVDGSGDLGAGHKGSGSLRIAEGVTVWSASGLLGSRSGSTGTAMVSGTASKWANASALYVGYFGSGALTIEAGGKVSSSIGYVGYASSSDGTVTVNGAESAWTSSGELRIGSSSSGTLTILAGGQVINTTGQLGYNAGASGNVTVGGAGSTWTNTGDLYVGNSGSGKLTVMDGGLVTAKTLYASSSNLHGNGTITVNGAILDGDLVFDSSHGPAQAFGTGGTLNLSTNGTGILGVGYKPVLFTTPLRFDLTNPPPVSSLLVEIH